MTYNNHLTLAVAGARKTQGIIEACAAASVDQRILILTYTRANQVELKLRLAQLVGTRANIEVVGWFSFLIRHFVRPFLPFVFRGKRVTGFEFEGGPQRFESNESYKRYFTSSGMVRRVHLPQLATFVESKSGGAAVRCLERLYDKIYIDEVQDLCGYDLEILSLLMESSVPVDMVGDVRQAVLATNERERKNKQYMYMRIWDWFRLQERKNVLTIAQSCESWRCRQEIAQFADSLFDSSWGFDATTSHNQTVTDHDGIFLIRSEDIDAYVDYYDPLFLRYGANSGPTGSYGLMNFRLSKGLSRKHVLVWPTAKINGLITKEKALAPPDAALLYVAVTRAEQSVAFVVDKPGKSNIPYWVKSTPAISR